MGYRRELKIKDSSFLTVYNNVFCITDNFVSFSFPSWQESPTFCHQRPASLSIQTTLQYTFFSLFFCLWYRLGNRLIWKRSGRLQPPTVDTHNASINTGHSWDMGTVFHALVVKRSDFPLLSSERRTGRKGTVVCLFSFSLLFFSSFLRCAFVQSLADGPY